MSTGDTSEERQLVRACCEGSRPAWNEFYRRYYGLVRTVVQRRLQRRGYDVEDAVQEVFLHLIRSLKSYDENYPLSKFVCMVSERVATDEYRFQVRDKRCGETISLDQDDCSSQISQGLFTDEEPQDERIGKAEQVLRLRTAFRALSMKCREILRLRYDQELPFQEIGRLLGKTENTVTVQARRCLDELRDIYQQMEAKGARS